MTLLIIALIIVAAGAAGWYLGSMKVKEERAPAASSAKVTQPQVSAVKPESPSESAKSSVSTAILPPPANQPVNPWKERDLGS